jgi:hypothetical protein
MVIGIASTGGPASMLARFRIHRISGQTVSSGTNVSPEKNATAATFERVAFSLLEKTPTAATHLSDDQQVGLPLGECHHIESEKVIGKIY